jgi:single-stranded DNA-binding protein 3
MINKVIISGRLVAEPELRYTPSNKAVATARIACPRDFKNQNGERESDFFPLVIWGKQGENFSNWIKKGYLVTVEGRLQTRSYENQQGQRVYVTEVNVSNFDNLQPRDHSNSTSSQSPDFGPAEGSFPGGGEPLDASIFENIPF